MAIEAKRGCGYRKAGGMYLVGKGIPWGCHRLPIELDVCPACGAGIKFSRGFTWIEPFKLLGDCQDECECPMICPACYPPESRQGLLWVGERYYSPQSFVQEAIEQGISKRIATIPRGFEIGSHWIYLAHIKAVSSQQTFGFDADPSAGLATYDDIKADKDGAKPGIFYVFRPQVIEQLIRKSDASKEQIKKLKKRGIRPIIVPDDDPDHCPDPDNINVSMSDSDIHE